jgi:CrcB protein
VHNFKIFLLILLGGALGSLVRYVVSEGCYMWLGRHFPFGTLAVNLVGSFLMGLLWTRYSAHLVNRMLWMTGFLGGFTTFSALSLDALLLLQSGNIGMCALYISVSLLGGLGMVYLGYLL